MKNSIFTYFIISLLALSSCVSKEQKEQTINISGAFALYPMVVQWSEIYQKEHPDVRFNISAGGAGKGMTDALSGTVDIGLVSREISPEEITNGAWFLGLCKDAVLPTISADNPYLDSISKRGLTKAELTAIFIEGTITDWNQIFKGGKSVKMQVYTRSDACGAADVWAGYMGGKQENLKGIGINGDPALAEAVAKDAGGIAFNNTIFVYDIKTGKKNTKMEVLPLDKNENGKIDPEENFYGAFGTVLEAISNGNFPSPPARELYFVAKGKPTKDATIQFVEWCLTEGQKYVKDAGYVPISQEKIDAYLLMLNN